MKLRTFFFLSFFILCFSCSNEEEEINQVKGLVSFKGNPVYHNGELQFGVEVQFAGNGRPVEVEYIISESNVQLVSSKVMADSNPDGMKLFFQSSSVKHPFNSDTYKGKTIVIHLDPQNKVTSSEYTGETYVNAYKKKSIVIN
jgi:hypothetical protein